MSTYCIALCSADRPAMLEACLESLKAQALPEEHRFQIVVVENSTQATCRELVERLLDGGAFEFRYVLETERGIPFARNTSVDTALVMGADWIGFIDDDETVNEGWMARMVTACESGEADVYCGPVQSIFPEDAPSWVTPPRDQKRRSTGTLLKTAATNNTFVARHVFAEDGMGLRFDPAFRFTGGSDGELFRNAVLRGCKIMWIEDAAVRETVPPSRLTLRWQVQRAYRVAANQVTVSYKHAGIFYTLTRFGLKILGRTLSAVFVHAPAALLSIFDRPAAARKGVQAIKALASSAGMLTAMVGLKPQPYKVIDGS